MKLVPWQADLHQIRELRLFQNVASDSLRLLLAEFRACQLREGEVLLSPQRPNQYLYLLLSGRLQVHLGSLDHPPIGSLTAGDCAGEISFIDRQHPTAFVVASETSLALRLHHRSLLRLFAQSPQLSKNLLALLCDRLREGNRMILDSERNAHIDSLTGSFNRRWLEHIFARESTRCAYDNQPLSMLMLDVDHFKEYNDSHGHLAGDYALCLVSQTLRQLLRPSDSLVRYGGEEFIVLLPEMAAGEAQGVGERLRQSLEAMQQFYSPIGPLPGVTISIGLAQLQPRDSLESLIARADTALYAAKQQGRNCLCH